MCCFTLPVTKINAATSLFYGIELKRQASVASGHIHLLLFSFLRHIEPCTPSLLESIHYMKQRTYSKSVWHRCKLAAISLYSVFFWRLCCEIKRTPYEVKTCLCIFIVIFLVGGVPSNFFLDVKSCDVALEILINPEVWFLLSWNVVNVVMKK